MAIALVAGFVLDSRLVQPGLERGSHGLMDYLINGPLLVILTGSAAAGSWRARRRRAREHADPASTA
jgi:hypothetical protein